MAKALPINEFLIQSKDSVVIDVRSEGEFQLAHIPGAVNIPLFNNEERAIVGTIYKQQGKEFAVQKGLEYVGPKLANFVTQVKEITQGKKVIVHCWRGGMRSGSFAILLETSGVPTSILLKGYKAYRNFVHSTFEQPLKLIGLGGKTGSGKTKILQYLKEKGEQVIDLEDLCNHKGSAFGAIGMPNQNSTEQFENNLSQILQSFDLSKRIWVEDESRNLGSIYLPEKFWLQMKSAPLLFIEVDLALRIKNLENDYASFPKHLLQEAILKIKKRLGGLQVNQAMEALANNDSKTVIEICLFYYDKAYLNNLKEKENRNLVNINISDFDLEAISKNILANAFYGE